MFLNSISVTPKSVKKVITNLNSPKVCRPDCTPVVVLKNCESELLYIISMCLKKSCFLDCWKVSSVVSLYFETVGERSMAKTTALSLFLLIGKIFEKLVMG